MCSVLIPAGAAIAASFLEFPAVGNDTENNTDNEDKITHDSESD